MIRGEDLAHSRRGEADEVEHYLRDGTSWGRASGDRVTAFDDARIEDWVASRFPRRAAPGPSFGPGGDDVCLWGKTEARAHTWIRTNTGWEGYEIRRTAAPSRGGARWLLRLEVRCDGALVPPERVAERIREALRVYRHVEVVVRASTLAVEVEVGPTSEVDAAVSYTVRKLAAALQSGGLSGCPLAVVDVRPLGHV